VAETGVTKTYVWEAGSPGSWTTITGATGANYTPGTAQLGKQLRVTVTFAKEGYYSQTLGAVTGGQVTTSPMTSMALSPDLTGDGRGDLLAVHSSGQLRLFRGTVGGFAGSHTLPGPTGLTGHRVFGPGDWTGDGKNDIATIDAAGDLWVYPGNRAGGISSARTKLGNGWNNYIAIPAGDLTGDRQPDLLGVDRDTGKLYLYAWQPAQRHFATKRQVGNGWKGWDLHAAGDLNKDGKNDIISVAPNGDMYSYGGNGNGTFQTKKKSGNGWGAFTLVAGADLTGDGLADIVGRDVSTGYVYFYRGLGAARFGTRVLVTTGW
jgi:hypothetical protein